MSLRDCIERAVAGGEMDPVRGRQAQALFDLAEQDLRQKGIPETEAQRLAGEHTKAEVARQVAEKQRRELLQIQAWQRTEFALERYRTADGRPDQAAAAKALFIHDDNAKGAGTWESRYKLVKGQLHARLAVALDTFKRDLIGRVSNPQTLMRVVREAHGERTGDPLAVAVAAAWREAAELARLRFNDLGGDIGKLDDWGFPHSHDRERVNAVSFATWRDFILPRLDLARMIDDATGLAISREKLELVLRDIYDDITTDGLASQPASGQPLGRGALARRRAEHRYFQFRSADDWLAYHERFGAPVADVWTSALGHLDGMARDIALLDMFGPNPAATVTYLKQVIAKWGAAQDQTTPKGGQYEYALGVSARIDDLVAHITGSVNAGANSRWPKVAGSSRNYLSAVQLGSAVLSSLPDFFTTSFIARFNGLPSMRILGRYLALWDPLSAEGRRNAVRLGLIGEGWSDQAYALTRWTGALDGHEITRRLADVTLRLSGLSGHTRNLRWANGMEWCGFLADHVDHRFADLPERVQAALVRHGLAASHWEAIRETPLYEPRPGGTFLRPEDIARRTDLLPEVGRELYRKVMEMIHVEVNFAVPEAGLAAKSWMIGNARADTAAGQMARFAAQYKNFAFTYTMMHANRFMALPNAGRRTQYLGGLLFMTMLGGAMAIQAKHLINGKDPQNMTDPYFWMAAVLQGGGVGIFGDFLFGNLNRVDRSFGDTVLGPGFALFDDLRSLVVGNSAEFLGGRETHAGTELVRFARQYTPGGSLWYARKAMGYLLWDRLEEFIDPDYQHRRRRLVRKAQEETGQGYWWAPGEVPGRAPDPGAVFGGSKR